DQRLYTSFVETFAVTRFPSVAIRFVHSGWGGDRVSGGGGGPVDIRLKRDVFAYHPTVVTIMLGMNDGRYKAFDEGIFRDFSSGYENMIRSLKTQLPNVRITAIRPSPYDDVTRAPMFEGGYNAVLVRYGDYLKDLAARENLTVADLNAGVVAALRKANSTDADLAKRIVPDRVHPGPGGHLLMAAELLKAWGAPAIVSAVDIDSESKTVERSSNTEVSNLTAGAGWKWTQLDHSLPMPIDAKDKALLLAVASSDFIETLNQQPLRVTKLPAGRYSLRIDNETVGTFSNDELAKGVNLATLATPMTRQAAEVHELTRKHGDIHEARWRRIEVPLEKMTLTSVQSAILSLDMLETELVGQQRATAKPRPHVYELTPAQ
ncbi:MAG: SGNH/GDSL hydrolase family protein, partial [Acidobacteria bacterium]|nr:SGNH/GDSL hydrolase family protein [Acidobacteriota bacterium]